MDIGVVVLVALAMAVGLVGTLLPLLPGLPIIWAAALAYGLIEGFERVGAVAFAAITVLSVAGMVAGFVLPHRRVAAKGAPASTVAAGVMLGIIGFFVIPVIGLPLGAVAGVVLAERARTADWATAWSTTKDLLVGFGIGVLVEFTAGVVMVGCWLAWVLLD
ncbi:MAG: DUF456 family protein [Actinomycetota bacterium]